MLVLDTDLLTIVQRKEGLVYARLEARLEAVAEFESICVTIISLEEQMRGWLAAVAKERRARRQVFAYHELARLFEYFRSFTIVPFDERAADEFDALRSAKIRLGTMDLKIAATALVNDALLLSANRRDFERVRGLRVENWLD